MKQSKLESLAESTLNILVGYLVALASQLIIFPHFGISLPITDNLIIGFWFTLISLTRSYTIRRCFNNGMHKAVVTIIKRLAKQR